MDTLSAATGVVKPPLACAAVLSISRTGSGPPLVLLHGIGLDRRCWTPLLPWLDPERDVVAVDLPGFGESPVMGAEPEIVALADEVERLLRDLQLERPHVAGNSLGGAIALELGARGSARSVCALSPAGFSLERERTFERATLRMTLAAARALDPVAERALGGPVRRTLLMSQMVARPWRMSTGDAAIMLRSTARGAGFEATLPLIARWRPVAPRCPTTIGWGANDRLLLTSRQAPRARRLLPAARHVLLRGCGHVPMPDDPARVARLLLEASA
jgi:pimeloyl-ACP methyl ester carboxylesterase